jgi:enoyl-CoA hydratase/carnithine racemase
MQDQIPELIIKDSVATITLRRPSQHNRIAPNDCLIISSHLKLITDSNVRVVVITGSGLKTFSSGYTLDAIKDELDSRFENMLDQIEQFPLPIICALNGSVYGGATDLALCCDFRIGVTGSRMLMPASKIGLHYYPGGIRRYIGLLGLGASKKLFLTALPIADTEMLRIGFLQELVTPDALPFKVEEYIESILTCAPDVLVSLKADLHATAYGFANPFLLRKNYEDSVKSEELANRLQKLRS